LPDGGKDGRLSIDERDGTIKGVGSHLAEPRQLMLI